MYGAYGFFGGATFWACDASNGDGEVCVCFIECALGHRLCDGCADDAVFFDECGV